MEVESEATTEQFPLLPLPSDAKRTSKDDPGTLE